MFRKFLSMLFLIIATFTLAGDAMAQFEKGAAAAAESSSLLGVDLPANAARLDDAAVPSQFHQLLSKLIEGGGAQVKQGKVEVLVWGDGNYKKSKVSGLMRDTAANLKNAGWNYEIAEQRDEITLFTVSRLTPKKRAAVGFWVYTDEALVMAVTEMLPAANASANNDSNSADDPVERLTKIVSGNKIIADKNDAQNDAHNDVRPLSNASSSDAVVFNLDASEDFVNVMGTQMPKMPNFPTLPKKPGKARGYVKDLQGNPLEGAYIGVRSSAVGGFHSGAHVETDAKGYYELEVPYGATEFYAAGYTIDYGEGRAAVSLYPADGKAGSFASAEGAVENFVLIYHGLVDRNAISEKPWDSANYYGGGIRVSYSLGAAGDMWASKGSLPENAEIEITLVPEGALLDGTTGKSFIVRRKTGGINNFNINNIPLGRYKISARLTNGKTLKMRKTGYDSAPLFGLKPGEAVGTASLLFVPYSADPNSSHPGRANWKPADVELQLP